MCGKERLAESIKPRRFRLWEWSPTWTQGPKLQPQFTVEVPVSHGHSYKPILRVEKDPRDIEIKKIIRECYEQLYINKLNNLDEMDRFLETHPTKPES